MKLIRKWGMCFVVVASSLLLLTACEDGLGNGGDGNGGNNNNNNGGATEVLSPENQKMKLQQVGAEVVNMFKTQDQKDVIELADYFAYKYGEYSWEKVGEHYENDYAIFRTAVRAMKQLAAGDPTVNPAKEIFSFPKATGIFEANDATREWEWKANSKEGEVVLRFKNEDGKWCEAKATGTGQEFEYNGEYETNEVISKEWIDEPGRHDNVLTFVEEYVADWGEYVQIWDENGNWIEEKFFGEGETVPAHWKSEWKQTDGYWDYEYARQPFTAVLPSDIVVTLNEEGTEHVNMHVTFDVERTDHVNFATEMRVANLTVKATTELTKTKCVVTSEFMYGSKKLLTMGAQMPSCVLVGKTENMDWEEWLEQYDVWGENVTAQYGPVFAAVDIMGQVQVKASSNNLDKFFKEMRELDESYGENEGEWWESCYYTLEYNKRQAEIASRNIGCKLYYGSDVEQARMEWRADAYEDQVWSPDSEDPIIKTLYEVVPVMYFPQDGTTYAFGEYFTERAFGSIIDLTEKMINDYVKLFEYNDIDPVEF